MSTNTTKLDFAKLNSTNYHSWAGSMKAHQKSNGTWGYVTGSMCFPTAAIPSSPTPTEQKEIDNYYLNRDKAWGILYLGIDDSRLMTTPKSSGMLFMLSMSKRRLETGSMRSTPFSLSREIQTNLQPLLLLESMTLRNISGIFSLLLFPHLHLPPLTLQVWTFLHV
jgi:hypothetical protein